MPLDDQKDLSRRAIQMWASDNSDAPETIIAQDYINHQESDVEGGVSGRSLKAWKDLVGGYHSAFSNSKVKVLMQIAEDDLVAFWATYSGIQDGPMGPYPATSKRMELDFAGMHRIADDKIVETWVIWDNLTGLTQLGHFPPAPPEVAE